MKLEIDFTEEEYQKLLDCLEDYCDCGPPGEGWSSDLKESVYFKILEAGKKRK